MSQTDVDLEIAEADQESISEALSQLLADSYTLYLKTYNYNYNYQWNVTGRFPSVVKKWLSRRFVGA